MHKIGMITSGNILVEMSPDEYSDLCGYQWKTLGAKMRAYRQENHLSQEALGKMVGLSRAHLCQIENENANFTRNTYLRIMTTIGD